MEFAGITLKEKTDFLKIEDGGSAKVIFRGNPIHWRGHYVNAEKRSYECSGDGCLICTPKEKPSFRARIVAIVADKEGLFPKVFEMGWGTYKTLSDLNADYPLEEFVMKITRSGTKTQTKYTIMPLPNGQITPEVKKKLAAIELPKLTTPPKKTGDKPEVGLEEGPKDVPPIEAYKEASFDDSDLPF